MTMELNDITQEIIGAAIEVHKILGPGLLESAYEECLAYEFDLRNVKYTRQVPLPVKYKAKRLDQGYRLDFLVENRVVVELKTIERFAAVHEAQVLTYLRFSEKKIGLLINFNEITLMKGLRRYAR